MQLFLHIQTRMVTLWPLPVREECWLWGDGSNFSFGFRRLTCNHLLFSDCIHIICYCKNVFPCRLDFSLMWKVASHRTEARDCARRIKQQRHMLCILSATQYPSSLGRRLQDSKMTTHYFKWKYTVTSSWLVTYKPKSPGQLIWCTELFKCITTIIEDVSNAPLRFVSWAQTAGQPGAKEKHVLVMISKFRISVY